MSLQRYYKEKTKENKKIYKHAFNSKTFRFCADTCHLIPPNKLAKLYLKNKNKTCISHWLKTPLEILIYHLCSTAGFLHSSEDSLNHMINEAMILPTTILPHFLLPLKLLLCAQNQGSTSCIHWGQACL